MPFEHTALGLLVALGSGVIAYLCRELVLIKKENNKLIKINNELREENARLLAENNYISRTFQETINEQIEAIKLVTTDSLTISEKTTKQYLNKLENIYIKLNDEYSTGKKLGRK
jgi:hypothetical protein